MVGGLKGGSGQYVYQLGNRGFFLFNEKGKKYNPARVVNYHSIAIVDCYLILRRLELARKLEIAGWTTEPDCWVTIERNELHPDMYVELAAPRSARVWLEIDMGTEGQKQLKEKLSRYWRAYNVVDATEWPEFPLVLFVAVDEERERELRWLIEQGTEEQRKLFRVTTKDALGEFFV
jgi:hypothetical protein